MGSSMDSMQSFTFLTENLPQWIVQVDELSVRVAERYSEFAKLSHAPETRPPNKRNVSMESIRPNDNTRDTDLLPQTPETSQTPPILQASQILRTSRQPPIDPKNKSLFQDARRKRKPRPESILSGASGPARYRLRSSLIVYYDSAIQEAFEALVRNIGSARNNLRKGKTTVSFKHRMSSLGMGLPSSLSRAQRASDFITLGEKLAQPKSMALDNRDSTTRPDPLAAFDRADKVLETAQSLCEVAAHQFLREGDCSAELEGTRERFESCLKVAEQEVERLRKEEQDGIRDQTEEEEEQEEELEGEQEEEQDEEQEEEQEKEVEPDVLQPRVNHQPRFECSKIGVIEVDDDDDTSSVHIDLSAFRRTRRV